MDFLKNHPGLVLGVISVLLIGGMMLAIPHQPAPAPPSDIHATPPTPRTLPEDRRENFVFELERALQDYRTAVTQDAREQIADSFADDFKGDTLFDAIETPVKHELAHARVIVRGPRAAPVDRAGLPAAVRRFAESIDVVTSFVVKVADADRKGADRAKATVKWSLQARAGSGRVHIQERYAAAFRLVGDRWKFASLERLDGRKVVSDRAIFTEATREAGLSIEPDIRCHGCAYRTPQVHLGGVALADVDGDGLVDVFTVGPMASHLFLNRGGRFEEVTGKAGLGRGGSGALFFDCDNDGHLDLLVMNLCPPAGGCPDCAIRLYRNRGDGTFEDVTDRAKLRRRGNAYSACAADIDGDGDLDLFIGFYGGPKIDTDGHVAYGLDAESFLDAKNGEPDLLLRNNGDGTFTDITEASGIKDRGWTLACGFQDVDGDGKPDLYVVHDFGFNTLWRNRGGGTFEDVTDAASAGDNGFGMGLARADYDHDGRVDLYVSNMSSTAGKRILAASKDLPERVRALMAKAAGGNTLLRNLGGKFENASEAAGVANAGWAWGCAFCDYDNDGWEDLYVADGFVSGRHRTDL